MNGYDLTASLYASTVKLAWPAVAAFAIWIFRKNLKKLLPFLHLKHGETEIDFRLDKAEKEADLLPPDKGPAPTPEEIDRFEEVARLSPRAAMLELRATVETALRSAAERLDIADAGRLSFPFLMRRLRAEKLLDPHTSALLDDLRVVGNRAAHDETLELSTDEVLRFKRLSDKVVSQLANMVVSFI